MHKEAKQKKEKIKITNLKVAILDLLLSQKYEVEFEGLVYVNHLFNERFRKQIEKRLSENAFTESYTNKVLEEHKIEHNNNFPLDKPTFEQKLKGLQQKLENLERQFSANEY